MTRNELKKIVNHYFAGAVTCQQFTEAITDYLEGSLSFKEWLRFQMHLGICLGCRHYLRQMKYTIRTLGKLPNEPVPAHVTEELRKRFRNWSVARKQDTGTATRHEPHAEEPPRS